MNGTLDSAPAPRRLHSARRSTDFTFTTIVGAFCAAAIASAAPAQQARARAQRLADSVRTMRQPAHPDHDTTRTANADSIRISEIATRPPVVTHHTMQIKGAPLAYTATTGMLPIRNDTTGVAEGYIFYVAYTKDGTDDPAKRPLTFVFNGGPGSATVWLHMGAFGPKRVKLLPDGSVLPPPPTVEDNPNTLLDQSDLVFLDPVGTGFSRPARPALGPNFWGVDEDLRSVAEFIRLYLTRYERWSSPKFLAGESYGTTRAAGLAGVLADHGIALNGIVLISTVLNFETLSDNKGNDLGYVGFLPSYAAIAWYHKKLPPDLQQQSVEQVTAQAERFAGGGYTLALMGGHGLTPARRQAVIDTLSRFTGLSAAFIDHNDLRIPLSRFDQELMRDQHLTVGRLDGRFTAYATDAGAERGAFDPSDAALENVFTPVLNDYVRRELGFHDEQMYWVLGGGIGRWKYPQRQGFLNVTPYLESAFAKNPSMKLFVAMGYYDTATPYYAVEYTLDHLSISDNARSDITTAFFPAGHMVYIDTPSLTTLRSDLATWMDGAMSHTSGKR
jgi:carboxypeptidase C (cathepsin A)